jgi:hypothetical protein
MQTITKRRKEHSGRMRKSLENYILNKKKRRLILLLLVKRRFFSRKERRYWVLPSRGKTRFWEDTASQWIDDTLWVENLRMTKGTFVFICQQLDMSVRKQDTKLRKAITVEKRVAICLWHLATGEDMRSLGWRFDTAKSTCCTIIKEVCEAIVEVLLPRFIKWPTDQDLKNVVTGFNTRWGFPQCAGALDGTHIKIMAPSECRNDFYNRKCHYSIVLQAVADYQYR